MNKYFENVEGNEKYFSSPATSSIDAKYAGASEKRNVEPRRIFEKIIADYGIKNSGIVHRRYAIK